MTRTRANQNNIKQAVKHLPVRENGRQHRHISTYQVKHWISLSRTARSVTIQYHQLGPCADEHSSIRLCKYKYKQVCTNPRRQAAVATMAPNICGSQVWKFIHVTFLAPRTFRWTIYFWKIREHLIIIYVINVKKCGLFII